MEYFVNSALKLITKLKTNENLFWKFSFVLSFFNGNTEKSSCYLPGIGANRRWQLEQQPWPEPDPTVQWQWIHTSIQWVPEHQKREHGHCSVTKGPLIAVGTQESMTSSNRLRGKWGLEFVWTWHEEQEIITSSHYPMHLIEFPCLLWPEQTHY